MRILIVEDADFVAFTFKEFLQGHDVTCVRSFRSLDPLIAVSGDGLHLLDEEKFDLAFVDGSCGTDFEGPAIVKALVSRGIACVGMSTDSDLNAEMQAAGAKFARGKPWILAGLCAGRLPAEELCNPSPELLASLDRFAEFEPGEYRQATIQVNAVFKEKLKTTRQD